MGGGAEGRGAPAAAADLKHPAGMEARWQQQRCMQNNAALRCWRLRARSFNETSFEKAILDNTACDVFTFDCTIECTTLGPRHK